FLDNRADMKQFLRDAYPQLAQKLNIDAMTLAPGDLMPENLLPVLRKELAARAVTLSGGGNPYVAANVGTLAEVQTDREGKPAVAKLLDVPTLASIKSVSPNLGSDRFAYLTTNNRLFVVQNGKVSEKRAPLGLRAGRVYAIGASDLVIVDDQLEVYLGRNNGEQWQSYTGSVTKKGASCRIAVGQSGYYAYAAHPAVLIFSSYGKAEFESLPLPQELKRLGTFTEKPAGMFAEEELSFYKETEKRPFFFRPVTGPWEKRFMPAPNCEQIKFTESDGAGISTVCSDRAVGFGGAKFPYVSKDSGKTWRKP
ncbi:MAG TPA: hypothetical protein VFR01_03320, partial [Geobacterales bacterium]|nr:hypothetical protein [Geobacterales bacterium]